MASISTNRSARGLLLAASAAFALGLTVSGPARAGDDGQEPLWKGLGGIVGLTDDGKVEAPIDYRQRGKLVLPSNLDTLPAPGSARDATPANWPKDPDVLRVDKEREAKLHYHNRNPGTDNADLHGKPLLPSQLRSDYVAPGDTSGANRSNNCMLHNTRDCNWIRPDILEKLGLKKGDAVLAGTEPDRQWLTDPPKGYRMPYASTKATFDATPHIDTGDPRALLYTPPQQ